MTGVRTAETYTEIHKAQRVFTDCVKNYRLAENPITFLKSIS